MSTEHPVKSPEDARIIVGLMFLRAFCDRGHDGEIGIDIGNLHRAMTYLINTIVRNPVLEHFWNMLEVNRRNRYRWLDDTLSALDRAQKVEVGFTTLVIPAGARQVFIERLEKQNGAYRLEPRESRELLRNCHQAVMYFNGLTTRERCE